MQGEDIQQFGPVKGGSHGKEFGVPCFGTHQTGELLTDREAVVETVDVHHIVSTSGREGPVEGHQVVRIPVEGTVQEVAGAQAGIEQILAGEAGVQIQAQVIIECQRTPVAIVVGCVTGRVCSTGIGRRGTSAIGGAGRILAATEVGSTEHEDSVTLKLGGGGELHRLELADLLLETGDLAIDGIELVLELLGQALQFIGGLGDALQAGVEQGCRFEAGERLGALEGAVGIAGHTAVLLDQVVESLIGPVGGLHITELGNAGDLVARNRGIAVQIGFGSEAGRRHRQRGRQR